MVFLSEPLQNNLWAQNTPFFLGVTMNAKDHQKTAKMFARKCMFHLEFIRVWEQLIKGALFMYFFLHLFVTVSVYMWKSEDNFRKSILLFNHMGFKD